MKLGKLAGGDVSGADLEITGLAADSRDVGPGFLFAALRGVKSDGRDFIPDALARGAVAVLAEPGLPDDLAAPVIADPNPRRRLAEMAGTFYPRQPKTVVAVTGTNGKSSTVDFLRQIWSAAGFKSAAIGTLGVTTDEGRTPLAHTTPDPVAIHAALDRLARAKITHVALEASSHGLAQHRLDAVKIRGAAFTNLTQDHFDYHADFEDYFAAKMRLFSELAAPGCPVAINPDGEWGARVVEAAKAAGLDVRTFGWSGEALKLVELWPRAASQRLEVKLAGRDMRIELPLAGEFQALNALGAATLAIATGVAPEVALGALTKLTGVPGRLELAAETREGAPIFIDYAHTPDGLDKLLRAVRPHTRGRIILVFGCGGDRDPKKRAPMGEIAEKLADVVFVTDDNPRSEDPAQIRAAILAGAKKSVEIGDRAEAIGVAAAMLRSDDTLVIAGKGHETGQIVGDRVLAFSDVEEARKAAAALTGA
jgi:UDP-N-acetylmuramoyl-L-alanyl-D-glutamate--2,6-diaminopimelate ligase